MQYNLSVQRALPGNWEVTLGYAGSHGLHLIRIADANLAPFTISASGRTGFIGTTKDPKTGLNTCCRRNATFGGVTQRETDAQSFYNALQAGVSKRLSHGLRAPPKVALRRQQILRPVLGSFVVPINPVLPLALMVNGARFASAIRIRCRPWEPA